MSKQHLPPSWAMRFFRWFCREDLADAVEGDLLELYDRKVREKGRARANRFYVWYVITFFQPFAFRRQHEQYSGLNGFHMFYNNLKIGLRFINKHKAYTAINVSGLATGLSAFLLIALFIADELSYDRFHTSGEEIVRLSYRLETPNATRMGAKLPFPMKEVLTSEYPEVSKVGRFYFWGGDTPLLEYGDQQHTEPGVYFGESDIFELFDFELTRGNPATVLSDPRSIVLTESMVTKYFGNDDPMGKIMRYKNEDDLVVTGVLKDIPENSHIRFDFLMPIELQRQRWMGWGKYTYDLEKDWNWAAAWVYARLVPGTDVKAFEQKLQAVAKEHLNTEAQDGFSIETQPLFDIHLKSDKSGEARANGNMVQLYGFGAIAALILFIASVNFVNLTAAQSNKRLKEVGLRKVVGARRVQLVWQFITESFMLVALSSTIALLMAYLSLPFFNEFTDKSLAIDMSNLPFLLALLAFVFSIALLAGLKPSLAATRVNAIQGLANAFKLVRSRQRSNRVMVIGQFIVCNLLIVGILVINNQLDFLQNKDLGFDKEQMLVLRNGKNLSGPQFEVFETKLAALPAVQNLNRGYVAGTRAYTNTFKIVNGEDDTYSLGIKWVGEGFKEMFGLELIEGRDFDESVAMDIKSGILINETAVKALGWSKEESIGKKLSFLPGGASQPEEIRIIGVLADANFESLYDPVLPSVFRRTESSVGGEVTLKLNNTSDLFSALDDIEQVWKSVIPDWPFEYTFLNEQIEAQYVKEERLASAIRYFAVLAVFIACLGLFGLASFSVQQRTKEIGIRKVVGASVKSVLVLISKRFIVLIASAFLISIPLSYYLFDQWLNDFAYRVAIGAETFLLSGLISLFIAALAIGRHSLRAATINPVKTLRHD